MAIARPESEVIANFQDGFSYSKKRLEEAFLSGAFDAPAKKVKTPTSPSDIKPESIDIIMHELEIPRQQAIKALTDTKGDLSAALKALITPI